VVTELRAGVGRLPAGQSRLTELAPGLMNLIDRAAGVATAEFADERVRPPYILYGLITDAGLMARVGRTTPTLVAADRLAAALARWRPPPEPAAADGGPAEPGTAPSPADG
jgi:hypothetical protein